MLAILYVITVLVLPALDIIWFSCTSHFYKTWLGYLFTSDFNYVPAIVFYLLYSVGIVYFVIYPAIQNGTSLLHTFLIGAFFGLIAYSAYDLTNHATIPNWPLVVTIVDMLWGAFVSGLTSLVVKYIYTTFVK